MQHNLKSGAGASEQQTLKSSLLSSSYFWAALFLLLIIGWMGSGYIFTSQPTRTDSALSEPLTDSQNNGAGIPPTEVGKQQTDKKSTLFKVRVKTFSAMPRKAKLTVRGRTEADARVEIKAETASIVEKLLVKKGDKVKKGDMLCKLQIAERQATLLQAKANLEKAKADYEANRVLAKKGYTAQLRMSTLRAEVDAALSALKTAQIDLNRTDVKAPFACVVEEQQAKVGDYLAVGSPCVTLVDLNPLIVVGTISELNIGQLKTQMSARVRLVTGDTATGYIRFIASSANSQTRTFRIEVAIDNAKGVLRDGVTTDIFIPLESKPAHFIPSSILVLNDQGEIGVRHVSKNDQVGFYPAKILTSTPEGVWVSGLPQVVRLITVGQDFVTAGQNVNAKELLATHSDANANES
ncbi:MAG: efflux RND transporter periplasmic adaptor subunit [Pseudomonadota bacterium]